MADGEHWSLGGNQGKFAWVDSSMAQWVPQATHCVDTFHVVQWATDELEEIRRQAWRAAHAEAKQASGRKTGRGADVLASG